jgi:hypothetical protein
MRAGPLALGGFAMVGRIGYNCLRSVKGVTVMRRILPLISLAILGVAAIAVAQENDPSISAENVDKLPLSRPIIEYALAGGGLLAALAIGFMPSKRIKDA